MRALAAATGAMALATAPALAHDGQVHGAALPWTFDPWIVVPLSISAIIYALGVGHLAPRSRLRHRGWQHACYVAGWLALAGALVSPLHWLGEHLFTFHMIEHEIVMAVAAPLLVLARPLGPMLWALPRTVRRRLTGWGQGRAWRYGWAALTLPLTATTLHGLAIWGWHVPSLFDAAVESDLLHRLQHLSFLGTGLLFWWALVRRCTAGAAVSHLFATMFHTSILGALMALAPRVLYTTQTRHALDWGLTPLEDQQLAGLIMWVPAGTVYAGAALAFAALWIVGRGPEPPHPTLRDRTPRARIGRPHEGHDVSVTEGPDPAATGHAAARRRLCHLECAGGAAAKDRLRQGAHRRRSRQGGAAAPPLRLWRLPYHLRSPRRGRKGRPFAREAARARVHCRPAAQLCRQPDELDRAPPGLRRAGGHAAHRHQPSDARHVSAYLYAQ